MKKICTFFGLLISMCLLLNVGFSSLSVKGAAAGNTEQTSDSNFTNLIVFARFADENEFVNDIYQGVSVREIIDNSYNTAYYSVGDYYRNASSDKLRMNSLYLFDNGGSLQLKHERGYYAGYSADNPIGYKTSGEKAYRMYELRTDWSAAINKAIQDGNHITNYNGSQTYSYEDLDKNRDGKIDSITVIYKNTTQNIVINRSDPLWNYKDYADYVEINLGDGRMLQSQYYVQVINNYSTLYMANNDQKPIVSLKSPIHEMGHIFGLLDLYNSSNQTPVYFMSAMANAISPVPQGLSIKEKEALGWTDHSTLKTITEPGKYKVKLSGTATGTDDCIGYKAGIPELNRTLYLEYRNFSTDGSKYDKLEKQLTNSETSNIKSGLVCYLAQPDIRFPSNLNGKPGNWALEVMGGTQSTKSDAALGLNDSLHVTDKLKVTVTAIEGEVLTFQIEGEMEQHVHSGGQATCTKKAVCEECREEYGEIDPTCHLNLQRQGFKEPTQEETGYTGDLVCTDCHTIVEAGEVIDKLPVTPPEGKPEPEIPPVVPDKPPVMLEGDKAEVSKNPDNHSGAVFRSDASFDTFVRVMVDNIELVRDRDYTARSGSTIITLLPSFLAGLSEGAHNIAIVSTTGTATAGFSVISDPAPAPPAPVPPASAPVPPASGNTNTDGSSTDTVADPVSETASTAGSANVSGNSSLPDTAQIKKDSSGTDIKSPQCGEKNCFTLLLDDFIEILKKVLIFLGFSSKI